MIESAAYDFIKKEGIEEGFREGRNQVIRDGLRPSLQALLEIKFGENALPVFREIESIDQIETLQELVRVIKDASTLDEVRQFVQRRR